MVVLILFIILGLALFVLSLFMMLLFYNWLCGDIIERNKKINESRRKWKK